MKWHIVVGLVAFHLSLASQEPGGTGTPPAPAPAKEPAKDAPKQNPQATPSTRIDQRAQAMRQQIENGKTVQSHVRVLVRLKNGNRLIGVVKDGRLVERVDGLRFVDASAQEKGAGIRLWYTGGTRNYVFVPFEDFSEYEVLQQLSNRQLQSIEDEMQMEEKRLSERAAAARPPVGEAPPVPSAEPAAEKPAKPEKADKAAKTDGAGEPKSAQTEQREWFALLQDYPPSAGWSKAKRDEIARRFVVIGAKPSEFEQRFVDKYDDWVAACAHFGVSPEKKPDGETSGEKSGEKSGENDRERGKKKKK